MVNFKPEPAKPISPQTFTVKASNSVMRASREPSMSDLEVFLRDQPDDVRGIILDHVRRHKIDPNDPVFPLIVGMSSISVLLVDAPKNIDTIVTKFERYCSTQTVNSNQLTEKIISEFKEEIQKEIAAIKTVSNSFKNALNNSHKENKDLAKHNEGLVEQVQNVLEKLNRTEAKFKRASLIIGALLLILGIGIGWKITDQSARFTKIDKVLEKLDPDQMHLSVGKSTPKKLHKK